MNRITVFAIGAAIVTATSVLAAEAPPQEGLPSPYFIDEVHCEGNNVRKFSESWLLSKDEVEAASRVSAQETCENLLQAYGIDKYSWLSPDDLERTSTIMKQSGYFDEVELSIKKSELKNHVHVFLKVKTKPAIIKSFSNDFKYYEARRENSSRQYDKIGGEVTDRGYGPNTINTFGLTLEDSLAAQNLRYYGNPNAHRNYYLANLYWKNQGTVTKHFSYDVGIDLSADNLTLPYGLLSASANADFLWFKQLDFLRGATYVGPSFILGAFHPGHYQYGVGSSATLLPGIMAGYNYGQEFWNFAKFKASYHHSLESNWILDLLASAQYHTALFGGTFLVGEWHVRSISNPVLREDVFKYSYGSSDADSYVGLSKIFGSDGSTRHQVSAVIGSESISRLYDIANQTPYYGLRYKLLSSEWTVNLSAGYYSQRTY